MKVGVFGLGYVWVLSLLHPLREPDRQSSVLILMSRRDNFRSE
jgi:hypothetical protein